MIAKKFMGILALCLFVSTSCEQQLTTSREDRIVGTWAFEKVHLKSLWGIKKADLTDEHAPIELTFFANNDLENVNINTGEKASGWWEIIEEESCDEDGNTTYSYYVEGHLQNDKTGYTDFIRWSICKLTDDEFHFVEDKGIGNNVYHAYKIDGFPG